MLGQGSREQSRLALESRGPGTCGLGSRNPGALSSIFRVLSSGHIFAPELHLQSVAIATSAPGVPDPQQTVPSSPPGSFTVNPSPDLHSNGTIPHAPAKSLLNPITMGTGEEL